MKFIRLTVVLLAVALTGLAACSGDDIPTSAPNTPEAARAFNDLKVIGPSEIVFGIDVSDSISADELAAIVADLGGCLGDGSLFPEDGSVLASIWVYGDTIAPVVEALTAVTPTNVNDVFVPALNALTSDRLVTGADAEFAEFLGAAGGLLALGSTSDPQILVFGSGEAADPEAVATACAALAGAGVRVSAIAFNADSEGEALFESCATATEGYYESAVGSLDGACERALMDMLVVELVLTPETAELTVGAEHTVEAAVFEAGMPEMGVEGVTVTISVTGGPNAGGGGSGMTDASGVYSFSYLGEGGAGIDTLVATAEQPNTGSALTDTVTVTWMAPTPAEISLTPETAELVEGEEHMVEAKVFESGNESNVFSGVTVMIEVIGGPNMGVAGSDTTNVDGIYAFSYVGSGAGIDTLVATAEDPGTGAALADTATVTWELAPVPPVCDAGGPYLVDVAADTVFVMLDATASSDANGDSLIFEWSVESEYASLDDASSATPTLTVWGEGLCMTPMTVDLLVMAAGDSSMCSAEVEFNEMRLPTVTAMDPVILWPPNHKFVTYEAADLLSVEGGGCNTFDWDDVSVVEVRSNEPMDGKGDGAHQPDMQVVCPNTVRVRSERSGNGDGRVYTIVYRVSFMDGSTEDLEAEIHVPHDQRDTCTDDHGGIDGGHTVTGCVDGGGDE